MNPNLLVVGARDGSLGEAVTYEASARGYTVVTAGVTGLEDLWLDVTNVVSCAQAINRKDFSSIVCTAGINLSDGGSLTETFRKSFNVNAMGPIMLLEQWISHWKNKGYYKRPPLNYVAISSNSARIPRSQSAAYCMSKAALSMGLRCVARREASQPFNIYGYEPGWIDGTPMSDGVQKRLHGVSDVKELHRIPGARSADAQELAAVIVGNLKYHKNPFNGTMIPYDGGEQ